MKACQLCNAVKADDDLYCLRCEKIAVDVQVDLASELGMQT